MLNVYSRQQLPTYDSKRDIVGAELKLAGANRYDMKLPETHYLPTVMRPDEHVMAVVFGKYVSGRGALIATDRRLLFIDKKPLYIQCDEIGFGVVGGVTLTRVGLSGIVTLHTRLGDYKLRTFNHKSANNFINYIDEVCLQSLRKEPHYDFTT